MAAVVAEASMETIPAKLRFQAWGDSGVEVQAMGFRQQVARPPSPRALASVVTVPTDLAAVEVAPEGP